MKSIYSSSKYVSIGTAKSNKKNHKSKNKTTTTTERSKTQKPQVGRGEMAARNAILKHLRINVVATRTLNPTLSFTNLIRRNFSEEVRGSFLDKSEVSDRVVSVVKNFQKIDPSKVLLINLFLFLLLLLLFMMCVFMCVFN